MPKPTQTKKAEQIKNIGDTIWYATSGIHATQITCPDCAGALRIRLILANDEQVSIDCGGCARGYEGSCGTITEYKFKVEIKHGIINGIDQERDKVTYKINAHDGYYHSLDSADVFDSDVEAIERSKQLVKEAVDKERDRLLKKEKDTRSWAWNASYHRRNIKEAEKTLAYNRAKLSVASAKAKEEPK